MVVGLNRSANFFLFFFSPMGCESEREREKEASLLCKTCPCQPHRPMLHDDCPGEKKYRSNSKDMALRANRFLDEKTAASMLSRGPLSRGTNWSFLKLI